MENKYLPSVLLPPPLQIPACFIGSGVQPWAFLIFCFCVFSRDWQAARSPEYCSINLFNMLQKHLSAGTGSLVMESQQVKQTCPSDGGAGHRSYYCTALCRRGTVPGIEGGVPPTPRSDPLQRQTDGQMEELRGPFPENHHLLCALAFWKDPF